MAMKERFFELGREGERVVREWLKSEGYAILRASDIDSGGAPILEGRRRIILPNNLTWREGSPGWVEVKTKSHATWHQRPPRRWEHGLPLRHWEAYLAIEQVTRIPVSLAILELESGFILLARIEDLKANKRGFFMDGEPHIFLDRDDFEWFTIDLSLPNPIQPVADRTLFQGEAPKVKQLRLKL